MKNFLHAFAYSALLLFGVALHANVAPVVNLIVDYPTHNFGETITIALQTTDADSNLQFSYIVAENGTGPWTKDPNVDFSPWGNSFGYQNSTEFILSSEPTSYYAPTASFNKWALFRPANAGNFYFSCNACDGLLWASANSTTWVPAAFWKTVTVVKATPVVSNWASTTKVPQSGINYTVQTSDLTAAFSNPYSAAVAQPTGAPTYSIVGSGTTVSAGTVITAGTNYTIRATYPGDTNYNSKTADVTWTLNKIPQSAVAITSGNSSTYGSAYTAIASGGTGSGAYVWTLVSSNPAGASINSSTGAITTTGAGTVVFNCYRAGDANYNASATTANFTLTVGKADQSTVWINSGTSVSNGSSYSATAAGGSSTGAYVWTLVSSSPAGATINSSTGAVTTTGIGTVVFNCYRAADANYNQSATTANFTLTVANHAPVVSLVADYLTHNFGETILLSLQTTDADSNLQFSYIVAQNGTGPWTKDPNVDFSPWGNGFGYQNSTEFILSSESTSFYAPTASFNKWAKFRPANAGSFNFSCNASDGYSWASGDSTTWIPSAYWRTVVVAKATPTISNWPATSTKTPQSGINYTVQAGDLAVLSNPYSTAVVQPAAPTYSIVGTGAAVSVGTVLSAGTTYTIHAAYPGDTNYNAVAADATWTVNAVPQTITFPNPSAQTFGTPLTLSATASSGLSVIYIVTGGPATVSGNVVTFTGTGSVTVQATQPGNANYSAATSVNQSFSVNPKTTTPTISIAATSAQTYSASAHSLAVSATLNGTPTPSGGTVTFNFKNAGGTTVATTTGSVVSGVASGTITIPAGMAAASGYFVSASYASFTAGNYTWTSVSGSGAAFVIAKASQTVTLSGASTINKGGSITFTVTGGLTGNLVWGGTSGAAGATVSFPTVGSYTVTVQDSGNGNYNASNVAMTTVNVTQINHAPVVNLIADYPTHIFGENITIALVVTDADSDLHFSYIVAQNGTGAWTKDPAVDFSPWGNDFGYQPSAEFLASSEPSAYSAAPLASITKWAVFQPANAGTFNFSCNASDGLAWASSDSTTWVPSAYWKTVVVAKATPNVHFQAATKATSGVSYTVSAKDLNAIFANPFSPGVTQPTGATTYSIVESSTQIAAGSVLSVGNSYTIRASYPGDTNYNATTVDAVFTVINDANLARQTTPIQITSAASIGLGQSYFATATGGDGTGALSWGLGAGSTAAGATIDPVTGAVSSTGKGTVIFHAIKDCDSNYKTALSADFTLTVGDGQSQIVTFTAPPASATLDQGTISVSATSDSGLPITYTFDNPGVVSGIDSSGNVTLIGVGQVQITATQAGNATYASASSSLVLNVTAPGTTTTTTSSGNDGGFVTLVTFTTPSGTPSDFTCKVQQGDGTNWLSTTVYQSTPFDASSRDVTMSTYTGDAGTPVAQSSSHYADQDWGTEELMSATVDGLTTSYTYYSTRSAKGNYRRLRSVTEPTGNWVAYQYSDGWDDRGQITTEYHPFLDTPATVGFGANSGRVISYTYQASWTGRFTRPLTREEKINGTTVAYTTYDPADLPATGNFKATEGTTVTAYRTISHTQSGSISPSDSLTQTSTNSNFQADAGPDAPGRPYYSVGADGTKTSFNDSYGGAYDWTNHTLSLPGNPVYFRTIAAHGASTNADGNATLITKYDDNTLFSAKQLDDIWMIPNKSTVDICIYDNAYHKLREETRIFVSASSFPLISWTDYTYDVAGRMLTSTSSNGATTSNTYKNGLLTSSMDATGVVQSYTYDIAGRPISVTKQGVGTQPSITTIMTYDGAGRVTKSVTGNTLISSKIYDVAGRVTSSTVPGGDAGYTTGYTYTLGGSQITVQNPDNGMVTTETYPDGSLKSVSGSAVIAQTFTHAPDSTANHVLKHTSYPTGYPGSAKVTYCDMMGSPVEEHSPGYNGGADIVKTSEYNPKGQVAKISQTGAPTTLYEYDALGRIKRQGSHIDGGTTLTLASNDRITEQDSYFSTPNDGITWFATSTQSVYAQTGTNGASPTMVSKTDTQLNNFSGGVIANTTATDIYGNATVSMTTLDEANKKVTTTTTAPDSASPAESVFINGLLQSSTDTSGILTTYGYDALGRQITVTDALKRTTTTSYLPKSSQVYTITDAAGVMQQVYNYDAAGRVSVSAVPNPHYGINGDTQSALFARYDYDLMGHKIHEWGGRVTPTEILYDTRGRQWEMNTFATSDATLFKDTGWPGGVTPSATTTWSYDPNTNLVLSKSDAGKTVSFVYTAENKLWKKINVRQQVTTYFYSATTGELSDEKYFGADGTTSIATPIHYDYNRLGQTQSVTDDAGTRTFTYNTAGTLELSRQDFTAGDFANQRITYGIDTTTSGAKGRSNEIDFGLSTNATLNQAVAYGYQTDGRVSSVSSGGNQYTYAHKTSSHLIDKGTLGSYTDARGYEALRDWSKSRQATYGVADSTPTTLSSFNHTFDLSGRITTTTKTGTLFDAYDSNHGGLSTAYAYDNREELIGEKTSVVATGVVLAGRDNGTAELPGFSYDNMGNRVTTRHNALNDTDTGHTTVYTTNELNQYTNVASPGIYDVAGYADPSSTIGVTRTAGTGTPGTTLRASEYYFNPFGLDNSSTAAWAKITISDGFTDPSPTVAAYLVPQKIGATTPFAIQYDDDGNMTDDGTWLYTYDSKNQLISIETSATAKTVVPAANIAKYSFTYDYLGRRIKKQTYTTTNGGATWNETLASQERYLYDGWNLAVVLDASNAKLRSYVWGLDLSGSMQGAGGVGGLLMVEDNGNAFLPAYDTNGNVHGLVTLNNATFGSVTYPAGSLVASYEYDAFGQTLREEGPYAGYNPFRYSTKYTDIETDLVYYGQRYYSPGIGRFINTDPAEEAGGVNLYAFCGNNGIGSSDYLGMGEQGESSFYGVMYSPGSHAYDDFVAYANGGFGNSGSGNFSLSFSGGDFGNYLPSTARSGGTVFIGQSPPNYYPGAFSKFTPPDSAGVGNNTNSAQVHAIATPAGSTNLAGGVNAPNSQTLGAIGQSFKGFFYDGPKALINGINQAFYHPINTVTGIGKQLAYETKWMATDFTGYWSTYGRSIKSALSDPNASGQLQFNVVLALLPAAKFGQAGQILAAEDAGGQIILHGDQVIMNNYARYYNEAWSQTVQRFNAGEITIPAGQSWRTVLGQYTDAAARGRLRNFLARESIPEGPGTDVLVNRWLRDPSGSGAYRIPDVRLQQTGTILDGTIGTKTLNTPQIQDFINFSGGNRVIIVRPTVLPVP